MADLKFADTHNLVMFLSKPIESEGFEQIVDFLNSNPIRYALTINPTIYISCIEQFWSTVKAKTVNEEVQLHAPVDGKKIIIIESTMRRDLQLEDTECVDCLPNSTIFEQLTLMGSKTTAWNEFSSTMASTIICLATNKKFDFSKYIFESMMKNLDNMGKFLMYPRFIQVFLDKQLEGIPTHNKIYIAPSHTKKIFRNMRRKQKPRKPKRKDTQIPQSSGPTEHVVDEAVYKELDDSLVRAATTASSLEAEQDSGGGPRQETMGDTIAQTRFENVSKHSNDPLLARVLDLEKTKTTQAKEIVSLKRRVKKHEQKKRSRTHGLKRLYKAGLTARVESPGDEESLGEDASKQGRINAIDADEDITLVNDQDDADMFDVNTLTGDEVLAEQEVTTKDVNLTVDEVTLAQALAALKSVKSKVKGDVIEETSVPVSAASTKDKGKGIMVEPEKTLKKKDQISFDDQEAIRLHAKFDEEEILAREKDEANFTTKQKATLFKELLEQRRKHFAAKREEEKRNKPPTKTQQKKTMITYLKNMKDLVEGSSKRAGDGLEQEVTKKQKVDDDQEAAKIKELMKNFPDEEEVAIDAIPLATKPLTIVDWKIHKEGKKNYYQIIKADGSLNMYLVFSHMLKSFDKEDFETLWKLVKAKYRSTRPVEDLDLILWGDLKIMFEPHVEDIV
ncbi:hypothetical protein Tco_1315645 [Tanacetum coccineum]